MPEGLGLYDESKHGVSYTTLSTWLECREHARLKLAGWKGKRTSLGLTFGTIFHVVNETGYREISDGKIKKPPSNATVLKWIAVAEAAWRKEHRRAGPDDLQKLELSLMFAGAVLPFYYHYWWGDISSMDFTGIEEWFSVPFKLNNGRWVKINGKWDAVYRLKRGLWLQESKSSSRIDVEILPDLLPMSMQSKMYLLLYHWKYGKRLRGFLRDIVRRPNLRQGKNESLQKYVDRCVDDVKKRPEHYFHRYEICIVESDLREFEVEFVNILTDFWRWRWDNVGHYPNTNNCQTKYGLCEMFQICARGDFSLHYQTDWAKKEAQKHAKIRIKKRRGSND